MIANARLLPHKGRAETPLAMVSGPEHLNEGTVQMPMAPDATNPAARKDRATISKALRFTILARDGFRCRYCGADPSTTTLHVDHILAVAAGGKNAELNLVTACIDCNLGKSDRLIMGIPEGFFVEARRRKRKSGPKPPARIAAVYSSTPKPVQPAPIGKIAHELWPWEIDSLDEIDEYCQLALVWCETHQKYEWHNLPIEMQGQSWPVTRATRANWKGDM